MVVGAVSARLLAACTVESAGVDTMMKNVCCDTEKRDASESGRARLGQKQNKHTHKKSRFKNKQTTGTVLSERNIRAA